jgi:hypothetical protein
MDDILEVVDELPHLSGGNPACALGGCISFTNTQETQASFSVEDFQPRVSIDAGQIIGKRTRNGEAYTPAEGTGRITTREVWKLIDNLKDIIHRQTSFFSL